MGIESATGVDMSRNIGIEKRTSHVIYIDGNTYCIYIHITNNLSFFFIHDDINM